MNPNPPPPRNKRAANWADRRTRREHRESRRLTEGLRQMWMCDDPCDRMLDHLRVIDRSH